MNKLSSYFQLLCYIGIKSIALEGILVSYLFPEIHVFCTLDMPFFTVVTCYYYYYYYLKFSSSEEQLGNFLLRPI